MPEYIVEIKELCTYYITIDADDSEIAENKAFNHNAWIDSDYDSNEVVKILVIKKGDKNVK